MSEIITSDRRMRELMQLAKTVASSKATVLIQGESGTGKELMAALIHESSTRVSKPFVAINCAAIPENLLESELFGYERGAFTGAVSAEAGKFEFANGGTLLLDEISEMDLKLQSKLLRFLQDKRFTPLGGTRVIEADVRVVAATSRTALEKGGQGQQYVQEALLGRLGAQPIVIPPLRDRVEDVGRLAAYFLELAGDERGFEPEAFHALLLHTWPLNVRELSKVVSEASLLSRGVDAIGLEHLPDAVTANLDVHSEELDDEDTNIDVAPAAHDDLESGRVAEFNDAPRTSRTAEKRTRRPAPTREELTTLLARFDGSVAQVARHLNRQYAVVWRCIQRYGIDANKYRPASAQRPQEP